MANRTAFITNALIDTIIDWTDGDSKLAIREIVDKGVQPNELLDYFDANTIVEALSDNEDEAVENINDIFDNADTLPDNSELIENKNWGDSAQAIIETALTQAGIPYTWEDNKEGAGWINIYKGSPVHTKLEIYFDEDGNFTELY